MMILLFITAWILGAIMFIASGGIDIDELTSKGDYDKILLIAIITFPVIVLLYIILVIQKITK